MSIADIREDWCCTSGGVKWRLTLEEARELADRLETAENALRSIAKIKCRCDAYVGPCGCGSNAIEMAEEVVGCKACFGTGSVYADTIYAQKIKCADCDGSGIRP